MHRPLLGREGVALIAADEDRPTASPLALMAKA